MAAAIAALPRAPICGIGTYPVDSSTADFEIGWDEVDRDTDWTHALLLEAGLRKGDLVLFSTANHEGPWVKPIVRALRRIGAPYATSETYGWDSRRFAMYLRRLPVKAVVGVGGETVAALETQESLPALAAVGLVWARTDALPRLRSHGIGAAPFLPLGPALGLGMPGELGARLGGDEWHAEEIRGRVHLTNKRPRATSFEAADTGVAGQVETIGRDLVVVPR
jgi:hypothetical protein